MPRVSRHLLSYHLGPEGHFPLDLRQVGKVPVIFEERRYVPPMQQTETETCCRRKGYFAVSSVPFDSPARRSLATREARSTREKRVSLPRM